MAMHRSRERWIEIVRGFDNSGLTQPQYAHKCGVGLSAFRYWVHKLRHEVQLESNALAPSPQVEFVEVFADNSPHHKEGPRLTIRVADVEMEFENAPTPLWLVEFVRGLERSSSC